MRAQTLGMARLVAENPAWLIGVLRMFGLARYCLPRVSDSDEASSAIPHPAVASLSKTEFDDHASALLPP